MAVRNLCFETGCLNCKFLLFHENVNFKLVQGKPDLFCMSVKWLNSETTIGFAYPTFMSSHLGNAKVFYL